MEQNQLNVMVRGINTNAYEETIEKFRSSSLILDSEASLFKWYVQDMEYVSAKLSTKLRANAAQLRADFADIRAEAAQLRANAA